jgi:sialate O-acetylesterase
MTFLTKQLIRITLTVLLYASFSIAHAQVRLSKVFSDNMVLQRGKAIPVWGTARPGSRIVVELNSKRVKTMAASNGQWKLDLPAMQAGGPFVLTYTEEKPQTIHKVNNVVIGDVWVASGQSNMEFQVQQLLEAKSEISKANYPLIRVFNVPHNKTIKPQDTLSGGTWVAMDSSHVKTASAVAYFFARNLQAELNVPIGIIQSTWGGTPVEAWTSREQLLSSPVSRSKVLQIDSIRPSHLVQDSLDLIRFWEIVYNPQQHTNVSVPKDTYNDSNWPEVNMPVTLKGMNLPPYEGMMWLRKTINIPATMNGKDLTIELGHPEMNYSLYFNGQEIAKNVWNVSASHSYTIASQMIKPGNNLISVRMAFLWSGGGFNPPAEDMYLTDGKSRLSLAGVWKYNKDLEPAIPKIMNYHRYPAFLFNGMINPIVSYGIKGFLWYQGEDNASAPVEYRTLFPMLIKDWRSRWKQEDLPFLFVQLPNYMNRQPEPAESNWASLREAQSLALALPNTGMATTIDIGEAADIHPKNKKEVGKRLALIAEKAVYHKAVQAYGPTYESYKIQGDQIKISFSETGSGLAVQGGIELKGFAIAGSGHKFYWANARIEGNTVIVSSSKVNKPLAVRYAWADNPDCNLINKERLPAGPFRTDKEADLKSTIK